jgi:hypothetical protein
MPDVEALIADALRPKEIGVIPTPISRPDPLEDQINQLAMQLARDHQHIVGARHCGKRWLRRYAARYGYRVRGRWIACCGCMS